MTQQAQPERIARDCPNRAEFAQLRFAADFDQMELLTARFCTHRYTPHLHPTFVIALIETGVECFRCGTAVFTASAGSVIVIPPGVVHDGYSGCDAGWSYRVLYPQPELLLTLAAELNESAPARLDFAQVVFDDPHLFHGLRALHRTLLGSADALQRASAWRQGMSPLLRRAGVNAPKTGREDRAVRAAQEMLRADLGARLTLHDVAHAVGLSPWHFNRVFARTVGMPPHAWRNQWRLVQAKRLLRAGAAVAEVAAGLGFADQSHLHRLFKRAFGLTPGAYARSKNVQDPPERRG
jgi:AraC-like DNA-binding protein